MTNDYTSSSDVFSDIPESGFISSSDYTTTYKVVMDGMITTASRLIDAYMGRWEGFFYPTTDAKTSYYDGSGEQEQDIDEHASITSVSVSEEGGIDSTSYTAWGSSDYYTYPYNASNHGKPITKIIADVLNGSKTVFYRYRRGVKIVGIPGYSTTTPELVKKACRIQAYRWFMRAKSGWQDVTGTEETGQLKYKGMAELDADVRAMLKPLLLELDR